MLEISNCDECGDRIIIDEKRGDLMLCDSCQMAVLFCSENECFNVLDLSEKDLSEFKTLISDQKYYKMSDINTLNNIKQGKLTKMEKISMRRRDIKQEFAKNKLEFKSYGDSYLYIQTGKPDLREIIKKELNKSKMKLTRRIELAKKLHTLNIELNENDKLCYEYINNIGCNDLNNTVRQLELNSYMKKKNVIRKNILNFD